MTYSVNAAQEKVLDLETMRENSLNDKQSVYSSVAKANQSIILRYNEEVRFMETIAAQKSSPPNPDFLPPHSTLFATMQTFLQRNQPALPTLNRMIIENEVDDQILADEEMYQYMEDVDDEMLNGENDSDFQTVEENDDNREYQNDPTDPSQDHVE